MAIAYRIRILFLVLLVLIGLAGSRSVAADDPPPGLTLNGSTSDIQVLVAENVSIVFPVGAEVAVFGAANCQNMTIEWNPGITAVGWGFTGTFSVQSRWIAHPDVRSTCIGVQVSAPVAPTPIPTPTPTQTVAPWVRLNGSESPITVSTETLVEITGPVGSEVAVFADAACTGPLLGWTPSPGGMSSAVPGIYYGQSRWINDPDARSACVSMTFAVPSTVVPTETPATIVPTETPTATATATPTQPAPTNAATVPVTTLPETGHGSGQTQIGVLVGAMAAGVVLSAAALRDRLRPR